VGKATSMTWSPHLKRVVSLALIDKEVAAEGSRLQAEWTVEGTRERVGATIVSLPFLDLPRKRA
jgi:glycine cleavage system aminomethyltransferase T